jgi:hypothetical protein
MKKKVYRRCTGYTVRTRTYVADDVIRKPGLSGTQATTRRRSKDRQTHTECAPSTHSKEWKDTQGYSTDVLQQAQYASASKKCSWQRTDPIGQPEVI